VTAHVFELSGQKFALSLANIGVYIAKSRGDPITYQLTSRRGGEGRKKMEGEAERGGRHTDRHWGNGLECLGSLGLPIFWIMKEISKKT